VPIHEVFWASIHFQPGFEHPDGVAGTSGRVKSGDGNHEQKANFRLNHNLKGKARKLVEDLEKMRLVPDLRK
jgi:hypothetical protein